MSPNNSILNNSEGAQPIWKVLFLDVDGVLNQCGRQQDVLTEKAVLLRRIVDETGCFIIVSSTWRTSETMRALLVRLLSEQGLSIAGWTPCLDAVSDSEPFVGMERHREIQSWLDAHPQAQRFVILDDRADMGHLGDRLVRTESSVGLTRDLAQEVISRLL